MKLSPLRVSAFMAMVAVLLVVVGMTPPICRDVEDRTLDMRVRARAHFGQPPPDPSLLLVAIEDQTLENFGAWPFQRRYHAGFLGLMSNEKPSVITYDILMTEAAQGDQTDDEQMVAGAKLTPSLVMASARSTIAEKLEIKEVQQAKQELTALGTTPPATTAETPGADRKAEGEPTGKAEPASRLLPKPAPANTPPGAGQMPDPATLSPTNIGPTQPFKHVTGDRSRLMQIGGRSGTTASLPFPGLRENSWFGFADADSSSTDIKRLLPMGVSFRGEVWGSLALVSIVKHVGASWDDVSIDIGNRVTIPRPNGQPPLHIPIDERGLFLVNYRYKFNEFDTYSYYGICISLSQREQDKTPLPPTFPKIKDRLVMVGFTSAGFDAGPTPLEPSDPMVVVHLSALDNILKGDFLHPTLMAWWLPVYFLFALLSAYTLLRANLNGMIVAGIGSVVVWAASGFVLILANFWVPIFVPTIVQILLVSSSFLWRYLVADREKYEVTSALKPYLSAEILEEAMLRPGDVKLGGKRREITVLFIDIRNFTPYCDARDPEDVVAVLNEYLTLMTDIIFKYNGTVDKYIGDAIMAFWNAPTDQPDHAHRAVCAAMEMRYAIAAYKSTRARLDDELIECGIGIHTGEALVGRVGSQKRLAYTAIGSTVNLAARLEALTKQFTCRILISDATRAQLTEEFTMTDLGETMVKGFARPVHVLSVEAFQDLGSALDVTKQIKEKAAYTAEEVQEPLYPAAPIPEEDDDVQHP